MSERHDPYGPSRLAMWAHCPSWEGQQGSEAAARGTRIHKLVQGIALGTDLGSYPDPEEAACARRCLEFLETLAEQHDLTGAWQYEVWADGVIAHTGGTADAYATLKDGLVIVDWKASDVEPDSVQGKGYALNLWHALPLEDESVVYVYFFNYNAGTYTTARYTNRGKLINDVSQAKHLRLEAAKAGYPAATRKPFRGCADCALQTSCAKNMKDTEMGLSVPNNTEVMDISQMVATWERLKPLIRRAKALSDALESKIMAATVEGQPTGYVVAQKGGARKWSSEERFLNWANEYADQHFLALPGLHGILSPAEVERRLSSWGPSHTAAIAQALSECTEQPSYDTLKKEKA